MRSSPRTDQRGHGGSAVCGRLGHYIWQSPGPKSSHARSRGVRRLHVRKRLEHVLEADQAAPCTAML